MRRFKQLLPTEMSMEILISGTNGVLSLTDADGEPYGVPLSYVYDGDNRRLDVDSLTGKEAIEQVSKRNARDL